MVIQLKKIKTMDYGDALTSGEDPLILAPNMTSHILSQEHDPTNTSIFKKVESTKNWCRITHL